MTTKWITKKGKNNENRHIPISERSRVKEKEIKIPDTFENEEFKTIERFSVDGKSYMDALTQILYGKYKNILLDSELIEDRFYVYNKRVKDITYVENAGHGSFEYILSKDREKYVLYGYVHKNGDIWHINAELCEHIG